MIDFNTTAYLITKDEIETVEYENMAARGNTIMPSIEKTLSML